MTMRDPKNEGDAPISREAGFSLLEILIAVMILVLMGGIVATNLFPQFFKAKRQKAEIDVKNIKAAVETYRLQNRKNRLPEAGEFPQCLTEPGEDGEPPAINPDDLEGGKLLDPWGNEYIYVKHPGSSFEILSYGDDGAPGGEGTAADISSKASSK